VVTVGSATVDLDAKIITDAAGDRIHLTPTEWHLLEALLRQPGSSSRAARC
jgi:two-component system KDP operon response regulator KdpE